jgi:hypothetical protein
MQLPRVRFAVSGVCVVSTTPKQLKHGIFCSLVALTKFAMSFFSRCVCETVAGAIAFVFTHTHFVEIEKRVGRVSFLCFVRRVRNEIRYGWILSEEE